MDYLDTFFPEYPVEVEILDIQGPSDLPGTIIPDSWAAGAEPAVSDIDLVAITPRTALGDLRTLEVHPAGTEIGLNEGGKRAAFDESCKDLHWESQEGRYASHVGLGACRLEAEQVARMDGLSVVRT